MKGYKLIGWVILSLIPLTVLNAQIGVRLHQPPPNQLMMEQLWLVGLDNPTEETYTVYLHGEVTEADKGLILRANTNEFELSPGRMTITASDVKEVRDTWYNPEYKEFIIRTGGVPAGDYTACVYVMDATTGGELGEYCIHQRVQPVSPPRLISPPDGATVEKQYPLFTWTPPTPLPPGERVTYELKIVEILEGQTKEEAMASNIPWYEEDRLTTTSLRYPIGARVLEPDKNYCWQIEAYTEDYPIGRSEIYQFSFASVIPEEPVSLELISPEDGEEIDSPTPKFEWTLVDLPEVSYNLTIWMLTGDLMERVAEGDMLTEGDFADLEPYFVKEGIEGNSFVYPKDVDNPLVPGFTYCWQVEALIADYPIAKSEIWSFNSGEAAQPDSCQYYLDEKGRMWHSLGVIGKIGIRHDSCKYVLAITGMYHSDGKRWNSKEVDSCECILAINGMFHYNGKAWIYVPEKKCTYALTKKGMYHYDGKEWKMKTLPKCTYIKVFNGMFHFNGEEWEKVTGRECHYLKAENGMFHFKKGKWTRVSGKKCRCILAMNGMYHYNGKDWTAVPEEKCTCVLTEKGMLHYDGKEWKLLKCPKCTFIKAYQGMYHSKGENKWKEVRGKKCKCLLAENGMYHYNGKGWIKVPDKKCTYAFTEKDMYHYDGEGWKLKTFPKCTYIKAYNGIFHFNGRKWVRLKPKRCTYVLVHGGKMYHGDGEKWELVSGYNCQWIQAVNGWYHYQRGKWNPAQDCNYRVKIIKKVGRSKIKARIYHYKRDRWVQIALKNIPIGKPDKCPRCTYYFEEIAPNEFVLYHCVKRDQPKEITRVKISR